MGSAFVSADDCGTCKIRKSTEFCLLATHELSTVNREKIVRQFGAGEPIYHEGDPCDGIYIVLSGLVGVRKVDPWGNSVLLRMVPPGQTLGYRSMLAGSVHRNGAEALRGTRACFMFGSTVRTLIAKNHDLCLRFLQRAANDLAEAEERVLRTSTLTVRARFAHLLLMFKDAHSRVAADGSLTLNLPLSRQDMAAMIGVRPESMSRVIRNLEIEGIAQFHGRRVRVAAPDSLIDLLDPSYS